MNHLYFLCAFSFHHADETLVDIVRAAAVDDEIIAIGMITIVIGRQPIHQTFIMGKKPKKWKCLIAKDNVNKL